MSTPDSDPDVQLPVHELRCLEVWGGSTPAEHGASVPGLDLSVHSNPLEEEGGGDLYLISSCSSGWISRVLLGDVSGHGAHVKDLSSALRREMHRSINTVDQSKFARKLNEAFDQTSSEGRFATALLMTYFAPSRHLILVNAGHPPPLICKASTGEWEMLNPSSADAITQTSRDVRVGLVNLPLGVIGSTQYEQIAFELQEGDRVFAYTDAYIEATRKDRSQIGVEGLVSILKGIDRQTPINAFHRSLCDAFLAHEISLAEDDQTCIIIDNNGGESPKITIPIVRNWLKQSFGLGHLDTLP